MVNIPKTRKTYCRGGDCKKHTLHKVTQYSTLCTAHAHTAKPPHPYPLFHPAEIQDGDRTWRRDDGGVEMALDGETP